MAKWPIGVVLLLMAASGVVEAGPIRKHPRPIPNSYIVVLRQDVSRSPKDTISGLPSVAELATEMVDLAHFGKQRFIYEHALRGFAVTATEFEAEQLANDSRVAFVEEDHVMEASRYPEPAPPGASTASTSATCRSTHLHLQPTGAGVHAYIIDTGVRTTHTQFGGRVGYGFTAITDGRARRLQRPRHARRRHRRRHHLRRRQGRDPHPVRVLCCSGSGSELRRHRGHRLGARATASGPAVANMSLGGGASSASTAAVDNSIAAGVTFAVAAGNEHQRLQLTRRPACRRHHRRRHHQHRRRARRSRTSAPASTSSPPAHHLRLDTATPPPTHQRHLDGHPARGGRGRALPATTRPRRPRRWPRRCCPDDGGPRRGRAPARRTACSSRCSRRAVLPTSRRRASS